MKGTEGYRPEKEMSGKSLRGRPGPTQCSPASDDDEDDDDDDDDDDNDDDDDDDHDDDDMWRKVESRD